MGELNNTINQVDLAYIYRIFYSVPTECASFSSAYGLFPREDHMLGNKTNQHKCKTIPAPQEFHIWLSRNDSYRNSYV